VNTDPEDHQEESGHAEIDGHVSRRFAGLQNDRVSKVWLITGSSRGLGRAFTEAALEAGHRVVATARNPQQLTDVVSKYGDGVRAVALDVTSEAQARYAVDAAIEAFGRLDVLVHNAGYGYVRPVEDTSLADFRAQIETNLFGEGFSESLSKEVEPFGIKVTIIEPGGFRTDFAGSSTKLREGRPEYDATVGATARFQRSYNGRQPGDPAKAAAALLHIASLANPPLRLLLGTDSYNAAEQSALQKLELDRKWKDLSVSTDYSAAAT
jgi:NAD(P)-dependent dehydrogenase (short-subunit alcohol dehydrogenase family)